VLAVFVAVAELSLVVVDGTAEFGELPAVIFAIVPAVMVTGMYGWSVPVYVTVLLPGKLASSPPKDSMQTAEVVPAREQSMKPVIATPPLAFGSAGIVYAAVWGPSVRVITPGIPQSLLSVPDGHWMA